MAYFSPGSTVDMAEMRDGLGLGNPVSMTDIRDQIYPYTYLNLGAYQNISIWRYRLEVSTPGYGFVQATYPTNTGQGNQVTTPWFRNNDYTYTSIYAQGYYPYSFRYWTVGFGGAIFSYGSAPNVGWSDYNVLTLVAVIF